MKKATSPGDLRQHRTKLLHDCGMDSSYSVSRADNLFAFGQLM